jgi:mannose-6-phosphate isomerase-like protein (cupin superfamily)
VSLTTPVPAPAGGENPQNDCLYVPAGTGVTKWVAGDVYTMKVSATTTNGSFGFVEASVPPGGGPTAHVHRRSDEAFYLVYGELEVLTGDRVFNARSGDFIFVPRDNRHRFRNTGLHTAKLLFMYSPGGPEEVFTKGGDAPEAGAAPPVWDMKRFEQVQEVIDRFDLDCKAVPEPPSSTT